MPWEEAMLKRIMIYSVPMISALTLAAGPAYAMDGPAYHIIFYTDASNEHIAGRARPVCVPDPQSQLYSGYSTPYYEEIYGGECVDGELIQ
jgi:hypothetical protein